MTDINQIIESAQSFAVSKATGSKDNGTDAFKDALNKAFDTTEALDMEQISAGGLGEITSKNMNIMSPSKLVSGQTDNLLKMLDLYSSKLEDPGVSLKSIAPVLEQIKDNAGSLLNDVQNLTDKDAGLKKIATQTMVTAQTEYMKFKRGDYLN
jgi:hypothetical protein